MTTDNIPTTEQEEKAVLGNKIDEVCNIVRHVQGNPMEVTRKGGRGVYVWFIKWEKAGE